MLGFIIVSERTNALLQNITQVIDNTFSGILGGLIGDTDEDKVVGDTSNSVYQLGQRRMPNVTAQALSRSNSTYTTTKMALFQHQIINNTPTTLTRIVNCIRGTLGS